MAREILARTIAVVGLWIVVASPILDATKHNARQKLTRAIVVGHKFVVIAGKRIYTTFSFVLVANSVAIRVGQQHRTVRRALLTGVVCKDTRPVVEGGSRIVIASRVGGASRTAVVLARRTVCGRRVVVASGRVLTSRHFIRIADPVTVCVTHNHHACAVQFS